MGWFEHRHYWQPKTGLNKVIAAGSDKAKSGLIIEDCLCGAVRQIEFEPGENPTVRVVLPPQPKEKTE